MPEQTELYVRGSVAEKDLEPLLVKLRMLCEPARTALFWYDEQLLAAPDLPVRERPLKRRKTAGQLFRLRRTRELPLGDDGAGRALCGAAADEFAAAGVDLPEPGGRVVVERSALYRPGEDAARRRHRSSSTGGADALAGLGLVERPGARSVSGRSYGHASGCVASVLRSSDADHTLVELKVAAPEPKDEAPARAALLRLRAALRPQLRDVE